MTSEKFTNKVLKETLNKRIDYIESTSAQLANKLNLERDIVQFLYKRNLLGEFYKWRAAKNVRN